MVFAISPFLIVVGTTGFEPATPASRTLCSTRLSHVPTGGVFYARGSVKSIELLGPQLFERVVDHDGFVSSGTHRYDLNRCAGKGLNTV